MRLDGVEVCGVAQANGDGVDDRSVHGSERCAIAQKDGARAFQIQFVGVFHQEQHRAFVFDLHLLRHHINFADQFTHALFKPLADAVACHTFGGEFCLQFNSQRVDFDRVLKFAIRLAVRYFGTKDRVLKKRRMSSNASSKI